MSKFRCRCGNVVGFNDVPCRYDGDVITSSASDAIYDGLSKDLNAFLTAVKKGERDKWLLQFYKGSIDLGDESVISDILSDHLSSCGMGIFQCERCGRIWMQRPGENRYRSYLPEEEWRGALETPSEDFVAYLDGQDFFAARISDVQHEDGTVRVLLVAEDETMREVFFTGVTVCNEHDKMKESRVRFLSEWKSTAPSRRFLFDSTDQTTEPLLEITSLDVRLTAQAKQPTD